MSPKTVTCSKCGSLRHSDDDADWHEETTPLGMLRERAESAEELAAQFAEKILDYEEATTNRAVYEVYFAGCRYEGGSTVGVFSTIEKATTCALAQVELERERAAELHRRTLLRDPEADPPDEWKKEGEMSWGNGMAVVEITLRAVDDEEPMRKIADQRAQVAERSKNAT